MKDTIQAYLDKIAMTPLLTADEEVELAHRIADGDKSARDQFIAANMRLAVAVAKQYQRRGIPLLDLIQEANVGLVKAVDKFDPEMGCKFSTYADWWIRESLREAIGGNARLIRLPKKVSEFIARLSRVQQEMYARDAKWPTDDELAAELGCPAAKVTEARTMPSLELESLDADDDDENPALNVADQNAVDPLDIMLADELHDTIDAAMSTLSDDEQVVLRLRFGLDDGQPRTHTEVARAVPGMTLKQVRLLEKSALMKMRHPKRIDPVASVVFG